MADHETKPAPGIVVRGVIAGVISYAVMAGLLIASAGSFPTRAIIFFCAFIVLSVLASVYLWRRNPEIFVARAKIHRGTKGWDFVLLSVILACFYCIFALAGLDVRWNLSHIPLWLVILGYALFTLGFGLSTWVYSVNKFAEPSVRIQSERGQEVIQAGPYAIVRHPLYAAAFILIGGMPLAMGSYLAFIPVCVGTATIIVRTSLEDRTLQNELGGYREYAARVRYRLVPGVW